MTGFARLSLPVIRDELYSNVESLRVKQYTHRAYRSNELTLTDHILRILALRGDEAVLDIGWGNRLLLKEVAGRLTRKGRAVGLDVAPGIFASARAALAANDLRAELVEAEAGDLHGYADGEFNRVMINYAL